MIFTETFNKATRFSNIREIIYNSVKLYGNNNAFVLKKDIKKEEYTYITYKKFLDDINNLGTAFLSLGLKDKRIAICGANSYEWALTYTTNLMGNIISIPLDKGLMESELELSLIRSKADVIVFDLKNEEFIQKIKEKETTNIKEYICMQESESFKTISSLIEERKRLRQNVINDY